MDFDDVLVEFVPGFIKFHNSTYGTSLKIEDLYSWKFSKVIGISEKEFIKRLIIFGESSYSKKTHPVYGASSALRRLKSKYDLLIITSRCSRALPHAIALSKYYWPNIFSDSNIHSADFYCHEGLVKKSDLCIQHNVSFFVEDSLDYANEVAKIAKILVFLLDYPWNQGKETNGVIRVKDWPQITNHLSKEKL